MEEWDWTEPIVSLSLSFNPKKSIDMSDLPIVARGSL